MSESPLIPAVIVVRGGKYLSLGMCERVRARVRVYVCLLSPYCMNLKIQFKTNIADITNRVAGGFGI